MSKTATPAAQLEAFIRKYTPELAAEGRVALRMLRRLLPGAVELVYDNYQWLVVGFGPSEKASPGRRRKSHFHLMPRESC